jgi:hypothetical protein
MSQTPPLRHLTPLQSGSGVLHAGHDGPPQSTSVSVPVFRSFVRSFCVCVLFVCRCRRRLHRSGDCVVFVCETLDFTVFDFVRARNRAWLGLQNDERLIRQCKHSTKLSQLPDKAHRNQSKKCKYIRKKQSHTKKMLTPNSPASCLPFMHKSGHFCATTTTATNAMSRLKA